jgi:hypothetical protein
MKHFALLTSLLLLSVAGFAQTYSNASLNGNYSFQSPQPEFDTWSKTASCMYNGQKYTATGGGQTVSTQIISGVLTFDGIGSVTATFTQSGTFDQTLSDETVIITFNRQCKATVNNGAAVFDPPSAGSGTGTYSVQSNGSGTITLTVQDGTATLDIELAGTTAGNISNTFLLYSLGQNTPNKIDGTGVAVRQLLSE